MVNLPTSCTLLDATAVLPMIPEIRARLRLTDSGHPSAEVTEVWWRNLLAVKNRKWAEYRLIAPEYSAVLPTSGVGTAEEAKFRRRAEIPSARCKRCSEVVSQIGIADKIAPYSCLLCLS